VLHLRVFGSAPALAVVADRLTALPGARHVLRSGDGDAGLVTADIRSDAADGALRAVLDLGVPVEDVELVRLDSIGPAIAGRPIGLIWSDLLSQAGLNARPVGRYLAMMAMAGTIAAFGVIEGNAILIVGAMAISPDTLPVTAACTALVLRHWRLSVRALATLVAGLGLAGVVAGLMTVALDALDLLPAGFDVTSRQLDGLQTVDISTPIVALAAGVAGMLALETRASAAVGVAISVTTIPASAYLAVACGVGEGTQALGALLVLGINVAMLVVGGCTTLLIQRRLARQDAASPG
jgi:uncharacterized hydrophobic protein (TIGR00271 family)